MIANVSAPRWRKSSKSSQDNCVEAALLHAVLIRDSKMATGPRLTFATAEWREFTLSAAGGPEAS
jgi:hypothetical protein